MCNKHKSYRIKFNLRVNRVEDLNFSHFILWRSFLPIRKRKSGRESSEKRLRYDDFIGHLFLFEKSLEYSSKPREKHFLLSHRTTKKNI